MKLQILLFLLFINTYAFSDVNYNKSFLEAIEKGNEKLAIKLIEKNKIDKEEYHTVYFNKKTLKLHITKEKGQKYYSYFLSPIHLSAYFNREKLLSYLLKSGVYVDSKDKDNDTALHLAAKEGHINIIQILLSNNAFINAQGNNGLTPLHRAVLNRRLNVVQFLVNRGADISIKNKGKQTAYDLAITYRFYKIAQFLKQSSQLDSGNNNSLNKSKSKYSQKQKKLNKLSLHQAVQSGSIYKTQTLLRNGAKANIIDIYGETALFYAYDYQIAKLLTLYGANVNFKSKFGLTPLHRASFLGKNRIVELLLLKGANVNTTDSYGQTALHFPKSKNIAFSLIRYGANINIQDYEGNTPLHYAVMWKNIDLAYFLLKNNANPNISNKMKKTAYEIALLSKNPKMIQIFKSTNKKLVSYK